MSKLVTIKQAAEQLCISVATLRNWRLHRKYLDFVKVGRALRVRQKSIDNLIEGNTLPQIEIQDGKVEKSGSCVNPCWTTPIARGAAR